MKSKPSLSEVLHDLALAADEKDALIEELQTKLDNRLVVAWMHPKTYNIITAAKKMIAEQVANHYKESDLLDADKEILAHNVPLFMERTKTDKEWVL